MRNNLSIIAWSSVDEDEIIWSTDNPVGLSFGTMLPGGFGNCSFSLPVQGWMSARLYRLLISAHCAVFERFGRRVYEGRIEDVEKSEAGVQVEVVGYYAHGSDLTAWLTYPDGNTTTVREMVINAVDEATDWLDDYSFIEENTQQIGEQDFSKEAKIADVIEKALSFGSDSVNLQQMHFAIWEGRKAYYFVEPSTITGDYRWALSIDSITSKHSLRRSRKDVYNRLQAIYDDPDIGQTFTDWAEDLNSQALYGIREGTINVGSTTEAIATVARDYALKISAYPEQATSFDITGKILSCYGVNDELYMVRAGQILRINDFDPAGLELMSGNAGTDTAVAFINSTEYKANDNLLTVELGHKNESMALLLARLGLSGGNIS